MSAGRDTLALVGDGDELDLLVDVEEVFGVALAEEEVSGLRTVGSLHALIMTKLAPGAPRRVCLSARAFRQMRAALKADARIRPSTPFQALTSQQDYPSWLARVEQESGLELTRAASHWAVVLLGWMAFLAGLGVFVWPDLWLELGMLAALSLLGVWLLPFPERRRPLADHSSSLDDLIRASLPQNFQRLRRAGEAPHSLEVWRILESICRDVSGHRGPITRETAFY